MIFFPNLYEDELLYSVLARYHYFTGNENTKHTIEDLFGSKTICATTVIPSNLKELCTRLPSPNIYTPEYLIRNFTIFPYYTPFVQDNKNFELVLNMIERKDSNSYMKLGITASTIKSPRYLRYCLECIQEDGLKYSEIYWHRTHQIEGVKICPKHHCYLMDSDIEYTHRRNKHEYIRLNKNLYSKKLKTPKIEDKSIFEHYKFIAEQTYYLLNNKINPLGLENLRKFYVTRLKDMGLATISDRIRWKDLIDKFHQFYGKEFLEELNCNIEIDKKDTWFHKMLRKPKVTCHPLRHILVLRFLGETIASMVRQINTINYKPFGSGPWPCLNHTADHNMELIINKCTITRDYKTGKPVGTFSCTCGFIYSRKGPDITPEDKYKIGRIKEFGHIWENELIEIAYKEISLRKKAEILGVDPMTVKRKISHDGIKKDKSISVQGKQIIYREQWLKQIKKNKEKSITQLRSLNPNLYMWLYRNDKEWLISNYPAIKKIKNSTPTKRVDWDIRDQEVSRIIESIIIEIHQERYLNKLVRITKNEIGRRLGNLSLLYKNLNKMPITRKILDDNIETIEQFQIRRIKYTVETLRKTKATIKEWEVIRIAGLKNKDADKLKDIIHQEIYGYIS